MALTSTDNQIIYTGSGTTGPFDFDFKIFESSDLKIEKLTISTEVTVLLTETTDYTVSIDGDGTGSVTLAASLSSSYKLVITRELPLTQEISYVEGDKFPAVTHEEALDRAAMRDQQLKEELDRCVKVVAGSSTDPSVLVESLIQAAADAEAAQIAAEAAQIAAEASAASISFTKDTDGTMAANSDSVVPSQKAVRTYVGANSGVAKDGTVGLYNMLQNGNFEWWGAGTSAAPDWWKLVNSTVAKDATNQKIGASCASISGSAGYLYQNISDAIGIGYLKNRHITICGWVRSDKSNSAKLKVDDGVTQSSSSYVTNDSSYHWTSVTHTVSGTATTLVIELIHDDSSATDKFDGIICVEGDSQFAFTPNPNDFHKYKVIASTRDTAAASGDVAVTGVGFTPKAILMRAFTISPSAFSIGEVVDGANNCMFASSASYNGSTTQCIYINPGGAGDVQSAVLKSIDSDGFTLTWTKAGTPTATCYLTFVALG